MTRVKSYLDYGAFTPIQAAACAALNGPQDIVAKNRELYQKRRDVMVESFARAGWDIPRPPASMFARAQLPPALTERSAEERRVGDGCVSTCRSLWAPHHEATHEQHD